MASLPDSVSNIIWSAVGWTAFVFKLMALALVVPFLGLIVFDFFLWIWKDVPPKDSRESNAADGDARALQQPSAHIQPREPESPSCLGSGIAHAPGGSMAQQRAGFAAK
ncbi:hypothetical protein MN608_07304 [Microdochium nivale]|nr:hypothetical protein MN608_07304 [Microdochium nivale]